MVEPQKVEAGGRGQTSQPAGRGRAYQVAIAWGLTDDGEVQRSIEEVVSSIFE